MIRLEQAHNAKSYHAYYYKWENVMDYLIIHLPKKKKTPKKKQEKEIYDKFMPWHQCKPLQCEVFPLREALILASSLDSYNSMLLHLAASIWDAAQTLF